MFNLGPTEMIAFGVIALMLFGRKLPEVARNLGGTYHQLRKNLSDFQREFQGWDRPEPRNTWNQPISSETEKVDTSSPKFIPPPSDENQKPESPTEENQKPES